VPSLFSHMGFAWRAYGPRGHHPVHHGDVHGGRGCATNRRSWGGRHLDPQRNLDPAHRLPFATIVTKDYGDFDDASHLNRPDVFRLNIGVSRDTFRALFGPAPSAESDQSTPYDFAAVDRLMPHPVYAPQSFVCVLNPSAETFEAVKPLLADAYARVATRHASRQATPD